MKKGLYIPKNEDLDLFSIKPSKEGLVVPLDPFGAPNLHLTIYLKSLEKDKNLLKLSVHITSELTKEKYYERYYEFSRNNLLLFKNRFKSELFKFVKNYPIYTLDELKGDMLCGTCFMKRVFPNHEKLPNKKEKARVYYQGVKDYNWLSLNKNNIRNYVNNCNDRNHPLRLDINKDKFYLHLSQGFLEFPFKNKEFRQKFDLLIKGNFSDLFIEFDKVYSCVRDVIKRKSD